MLVIVKSKKNSSSKYNFLASFSLLNTRTHTHTNTNTRFLFETEILKIISATCVDIDYKWTL